MTHICVDIQTINGPNNGLSPLRIKFHWHFNQNSYTFIQENAFENVVWKMSAILSWPQCVGVTLGWDRYMWFDEILSLHFYATSTKILCIHMLLVYLLSAIGVNNTSLGILGSRWPEQREHKNWYWLDSICLATIECKSTNRFAGLYI